MVWVRAWQVVGRTRRERGERGVRVKIGGATFSETRLFHVGLMVMRFMSVAIVVVRI